MTRRVIPPLERWLPIEGHLDYEVSDLGRVRSWKNGKWGRRAAPRLLMQSLTRGGYLRVNLDTSVVRLTHHLVLEAFTGPRPAGTECAHTNGDPLDNHLTNLRWATPQENGADNARHGVLKGSRHPGCKLTEEAVREIRRSPMRNKDLAAKFGVSHGTVSRVRAGQSWTHVQ